MEGLAVTPARASRPPTQAIDSPLASSFWTLSPDSRLNP